MARNKEAAVLGAIAPAIKAIKRGELNTLIPLLLLFRINNKPVSLKLHYQFMPMFNTAQPRQSMYMVGRQGGKTYSMSEDSWLRGMFVPGYNQLIIEPRLDQVQRFNNGVFVPLMRSCPIRDSFLANIELSKLTMKVLKNGSYIAMANLLTGGDSIRGLSGVAHMRVDECQDIETDTIVIAQETMAASINYGFSTYTGTPKSTNTTLALLWSQSSQAEWIIKCLHCGHRNIPNPDNDLLKMIGMNGPICAKCGKDVYPHNGGYVHAFPERATTFAGYHISQTTHPLHTAFPNKWEALLYKVDNYGEKELYNEIFGWPYDAANSPLTLADLLNATHAIEPLKSPTDINPIRDKYRYITIGCDWGGGGAFTDSYTAYAVLGLRADGDSIDVLYKRRIPKNVDPTEEARELMYWITGTKANAFAYDDRGSGFVRLEIMKHAGIYNLKDFVIMPFGYIAPRSGDIIRLSPKQREPDLYYYSIDKTRSLLYTFQAIKRAKIRFPKFNQEDSHDPVMDFLAIIEEPRMKTEYGDTSSLMMKRSGVPDDFAHAVNYGCWQIYDHFGALPSVGTAYEELVQSKVAVTEPDMGDDIVFGPRGDFGRFSYSPDTMGASAVIIE
jgi:hypothetical protein